MNKLDAKLADKVAVITGGGRGLGWSISKALAQSGAKIAIVYPPFESYPKEKIEELRSLGRQAKGYEADVTNSQMIRKVIKRIVDDFGRIDILVNNAGKLSETLLIDMEEQEWNEILDTDLKSVFIVSKAVLPYMIEAKRGSIINIASQLGYKGGVGITHYSAAKAGVIAFTKSLAQEVIEYGIRVNAVAPGPLITDMTAPFMKDNNWLAQKEKSVAIGRLGTPDEIAPTVVFLASSDASLYVGQTLLPNGGGVMI